MTTRKGAAVGIAAVVVLLIAGCSVSTDPFASLTVSGTVTRAGEPAPARIRLSAGNFATENDYLDGTYTITVSGGGVPASNCASVRIDVSLLDDDGAVVDQDSRQIGECGQHVVDFEFP